MLAGMLLAVLTYRPIYKQMYSLADVSQKKEITEMKLITNSTITNDIGEPVQVQTQQYFYDDESSMKEITKTVNGTSNKTKEVTLGKSAYYWMIILVLIQVVYVTMVYGPIAAFLVELFPTRIRYTSMSLPYHIGNGVFGGLTPFIATSLYEASRTEANPGGDPFAGLWYPIVVASITFIIGLIFLKNKPKGEIME
jgi:MHS family proline/betaine transporter-like MFS transporter